MTEKTMGIVMEIAQQMVECGAEIGRVEESIPRICRAYGCVRTDAYATLSSRIVTVQLNYPPGLFRRVFFSPQGDAVRF